jgi:sialate O-acetylesterase
LYYNACFCVGIYNIIMKTQKVRLTCRIIYILENTMQKLGIACLWFLTAVSLLFSLNLGFSQAMLAQSNVFQISPFFQDSMVLQQKSSVPVWGVGIPGVNILVKGGWGKRASTKVDSDGNWSVSLITPKAGGPYTMSVQHGDSIVGLKNILLGDVWLCSGQSNMEMPLEGWPPSDTIINSAYEINHAQYPEIRLFHLQKNYSIVPIKTGAGKWEVCSPSSVHTFSAAAFFFGKKLYETMKVPIGLIEASWGGTPVEAWMSKDMLKKFPTFDSTLHQLDACRDSMAVLNAWMSKFPSVKVSSHDPDHKWDGWDFQDAQCARKDFDDSSWEDMILPTQWEITAVGEFDGAVWFRKRIEIPKSWIKKTLTVHLGPVDDVDESYVNGVKVGEYIREGGWKIERVYTIPESLVTDSVLQIAVRVIDYGGGGGIWGDGKKMFVGCDSAAVIRLEGPWKYLPVAQLQEEKFIVFGAAGNHYKNRPKLAYNVGSRIASVLFNGMISPAVPFALKGVIWYQGEDNVGHHDLYKSVFPAMIQGWRKEFGVKNLPFYYVQIAPYPYGGNAAYLREAQFQTLSVKNTGMVVTLDIGNPQDIHPANKQDVGTRLALLALAKTYGKKIVCSGPVYKSMKVVKGKIILSFDEAARGLVLKEKNGELHFLIAGKDGVFKKAVVKIQGSKLAVSNPEISKPAAVRYAWGDADEGTLFNKEGLPASSFRTDAW